MNIQKFYIIKGGKKSGKTTTIALICEKLLQNEVNVKKAFIKINKNEIDFPVKNRKGNYIDFHAILIVPKLPKRKNKDRNNKILNQKNE